MDSRYRLGCYLSGLSVFKGGKLPEGFGEKKLPESRAGDLLTPTGPFEPGALELAWIAR